MSYSSICNNNLSLYTNHLSCVVSIATYKVTLVLVGGLILLAIVHGLSRYIKEYGGKKASYDTNMPKVVLLSLVRTPLGYVVYDSFFTINNFAIRTACVPRTAIGLHPVYHPTYPITRFGRVNPQTFFGPSVYGRRMAPNSTGIYSISFVNSRVRGLDITVQHICPQGFRFYSRHSNGITTYVFEAL